MANQAKSPEVVIVGGGSAGTVLANRLSEDSARRVLLLEAGKAYAPTEYPDMIANANRVGVSVARLGLPHPGSHRLGHDVTALRGKVLGGSSAINAAVAMRARPSDFARWSAHGIEGWSFDDVLPIYKAMENTPVWHDPIVVSVHHERWPSDGLQSSVKSVSEIGLDAIVMRLSPAHHALAPPIRNDALKRFGAGPIEPLNGPDATSR